MTKFKKITKKQFNDAYNMHPPNRWIRFGYKYFSKETDKKNMMLRNSISFILGVFFLLGFLGTITNTSYRFIAISTIVYAIFLTILVLYLLSVAILNNRRIKKIMKILDINKEEYNFLVEKFK